MPKTTVHETASLLAAFVGACVLAGCDVEQTQEGELPDVDVDADAGQLPEFEQTEEGDLPNVDVDVADGGQVPEFDVDAPDVDVGTREEQVEVPSDVDVDTEERTITVPDIDVNQSGDEEESAQQ